MEQPQPFTVAIDDATLDDLKRRLANARLPEAELVDDWSQGLPPGLPRGAPGLLAHGLRLAPLRDLAQQLAPVHGPPGWPGRSLPVHFIHLRSPEPNARPLLLSHGWPGSILEFRHVLGPLTDPVAHGGGPRTPFTSLPPPCRALPSAASPRCLDGPWRPWLRRSIS